MGLRRDSDDSVSACSKNTYLTARSSARPRVITCSRSMLPGTHTHRVQSRARGETPRLLSASGTRLRLQTQQEQRNMVKRIIFMCWQLHYGRTALLCGPSMVEQTSQQYQSRNILLYLLHLLLSTLPPKNPYLPSFILSLSSYKRKTECSRR